MLHVGVFDSGVGGLTVLKELAKHNLTHTFTYFGDTARCPYGGKSQDTILRYAIENSHFLMEQEIDCLVVACHTATALALPELRKIFSVPIIGVIQPAIELACALTRNCRIGVIGTRATIQSQVYEKALLQYKEGLSIHTQACPLFVPIVEEIYNTPTVIQAIVKEYLMPLKAQRIDTLILGCTHYPLLYRYIAAEMGEQVVIVDPSVACAQEVANLGGTTGFQGGDSIDTRSRFQFCVSDDPERFLRLGREFFEYPIHNVRIIQ